MATYYVDPDAGGSNNGSDWTNAWTTLQAAVDYASLAAGDIVYCRLSSSAAETPSVSIDMDGNSGSSAGVIRFIGCNSSGTVDGTRYVIDWGSNSVDGLRFNNMDYITLENFELKTSATGTIDGIVGHTSTSSGVSVINCYVHGWAYGIYGINISSLKVFRTRISNCTNRAGLYGTYIFCTIDNNVGGLQYVAVVVGCVIRDNTSFGVDFQNYGQLCMNNVFYNNSDDNIILAAAFPVIGNRFIDCGASSYHIDPTYEIWIFGNYFDGGGLGAVDGNHYIELNLMGDGGHNTFSGSDTNDGFIDPTNDDYNLASDATNRSIAVELQ